MKGESTELAEAFTDFIGAVRANGGKMPNVNEILRQVLPERDKEDKK